MKVLLVSANTELLNMPALPLGLAMVAAATRRAGHAVRFLDLLFQTDAEAALCDAISQHQPEVIGISVRNIDDQSLQQPRLLLAQVRPVVELIKRLSRAPIVLGGAGYSIFPEATLAYLGAHYGVRGEGEVAFPALLEAIAHGEDPADIPGVVSPARPGDRPFEPASDLRALPLAGEELWRGVDPKQAQLWMPVQSRRGCANDCFYCSTALIEGRRVRARAPREVAASMARMAHDGFEQLFFVDNSFNLPAAHARELCRWIKELCPKEVRWRCILYPHRLEDELLRAMAEAGCVQVALGFESGDEGMLRRMNKRFSPADVRHVTRQLSAHGIRCMGFLLLGGPGETRRSVEKSLAFADSLELESLRTTIGIRIYPGTELARIALAEGVIDPSDDLLQPRFYLAKGLDPWIYEQVTPGFAVR